MLTRRQLHSLTDLEPGDHLCGFYESEEERRAVLRSFISQGIERGEKILYVQKSPQDEDILKDLAELGVDVEGCLDKGCLSLVTETETYLQGGAFDPGRMIGMLRAEAERALAQGYPALRAIGDMSWAQRGLPGSETLVEYEAKLNDFYSKSQCLGLCQYDLRKFDPSFLLKILASHHTVIIGAEIYANIYHIPPKDLLSEDFLDSMLAYFLANLKERKRAQAAARTTEQRLANFLAHTGEAIIMADQELRVLSFNRGAEEIFGYRAEEVAGQSLDLLIPPRYREGHRQRVKRYLKAPDPTRKMNEHGEIFGRRKDGAEFPLEASVTKLSQNGNLFLAIILRDISLRRQVETKSQAERERFQALFDGVPVPTYVWQRNGQDFILVTFNRAAQDYSHGFANQLLGKTLSELYGDRPEVLADFSRCFREKTTIRREFAQTSMITGQWRDFNVHYVPVAPDLVLVHTEDITERKRDEDALGQQAQIIDQIHDAVVSTDLDGHITSWNKGAERIFGYSKQEALGKHVSLVYAENQLEFLQHEVIAPLKEKGDHELELVLKNREGQAFDAHLSLSLLRDLSGNPVGMIGYSLDVSKLKRVERELQVRARTQAVEAELGQLALAEGDLQALMDQIVSRAAQALDVEYCKILELQPGGESLLLKSGVGWKDGAVGKALVDARINSQAGYTLLSDKPVIVADLRIETRFGAAPLLSEYGVVSGLSVIIRGKESPYGILGAHSSRQRDFSRDDVNFLASVANILAIAIERKRAEDALKENEQRFRQLSENIQEVFWMTNAAGSEVLYVSPAFEEIWGRSRQALHAQPYVWLDAIHPQDRERVRSAFNLENLVKSKFDESFRIIRSDGSMRWVRDRGFPIHNEQGDVYRIAGIAEDITEQMQTEQALRRHAERLKTLRGIDRAILAAKSLQSIAQSALTRLVKLEPFFGASVVLFDAENRDGIVLFDHYHGAEDLHMGPSVSLGIFGDVDDLATGKIFRLEDTGAVSDPDVTIQVLRARGLRSYISVPLITQGELVGVLSLGSTSPGPFPAESVQVAREVADSMALAIQQTRLIDRIQDGSKRLRELGRQVVTAQEQERRRVSRELHDEASQALMALKISLDMLRKDLPGELEHLHQGVEQAVELADETMEQIRLLAHDLRPPELDAVGLDPVLEDYCSEFGKRMNFIIDYWGTRLPWLPDEISICFYRVLQEALTNILKHAHARHVQVALSCTAGVITLSVMDDGRGFDLAVDQVFPDGSGIGLLGMRERLELLGGKLEIESHTGEGTRLRATVPWENCF